MRLISNLKRATYAATAAVLTLAAVPVMPNSRAFADGTDCASDDASLTTLLGDASVGSFAFCGNIAKTLNLTRDVEIDLAGNTLTGKVVVYEGYNVTIRNGVIAGATINDNIISNKGTLVLENMNITANTYPAVNSNGGATTINGGTYRTNGATVLAAKSGGTIIVNSGEFTGGFYGDVTLNGGRFTADPTAFLGAGKDAYAFEGYWMVGDEATITASDATVPKGTKVEIARVNAAGYDVLSYSVKNSAGADASADVAITEEISETGEKVVYAEGLAQGRKEIDITDNSGKAAHATLRVYEFQGVEDQVMFKGDDLPMEIASNKWNIGWSLVNSTDENVATVNGDTVTAVGSGKATITAEFNDTVNSQVTFEVYVYDFDENDADTLLIKKGKTATVNTDSYWDVTTTTAATNLQLTNNIGTYSVKGVETGAAEVTFETSVNGKDLSKTVKVYVYEVKEKNVILKKGETLAEDRISQIIDAGGTTMSFKKFSVNGKAENDGLALTGVEAGDTEAVYTLAADGKSVNVKFTLHVWEMVTEGLEDEYDLGNIQAATDTFTVYDNNGTISYTVRNEAGEEVGDVIVEKNGDEYGIRIADGAMPGAYTIEFVDTVFGEVVATKTVTVRVHQINTTGEDMHYIVMASNWFSASENRYDVNVTEASGFTRNRNITARVTNNSSSLSGVRLEYRHGGNWRITANAAGSYEIEFSDGVASKTINVYVMQFTFGQDSYHVRRQDGMAGAVINAINNYWHEENVRNRYWDTEFSMVNDETGALVAEGYGVNPTVARDGEYDFKWCTSDEDCLQAGNYTITFKAYANRGDEFGGKTATKSVRLHIYEMVAPQEDLYIIETGDTLGIDVYDLNDRASTRAEITSGPNGGLRFATTGFWFFQQTDYSRLVASRPGVYTVRYTDYMSNGTVVDTYEATIVVLEVEEEELFVRRGETVTLAGSADWAASFATDDATGVDYVAEDGEIEFDTTGMELGEHDVYIAHDFSEFDDGAFPPRELVKVATVVVYDVFGDEADDMTKDADRLAVADFLAGKIAEMIENDSTDDDQVALGLSIDGLKEALRNGEVIETKLEVELIDEEEWEYAEAYDEVVKIVDENGIVAMYRAYLVIYIDGLDMGLVYELDDPITMRLEIPGGHRNVASGYTRTFYVTRGHMAIDGTETAERLAVTRDGDFLTFKNAKFSSFAIDYEDTLNVVAPDTGFAANEENSAAASKLSLILAGLASAIILAGVAVFTKRK